MIIFSSSKTNPNCSSTETSQLVPSVKDKNDVKNNFLSHLTVYWKSDYNLDLFLPKLQVQHGEETGNLTDPSYGALYKVLRVK